MAGAAGVYPVTLQQFNPSPSGPMGRSPRGGHSAAGPGEQYQLLQKENGNAFA